MTDDAIDFLALVVAILLPKILLIVGIVLAILIAIEVVQRVRKAAPT